MKEITSFSFTPEYKFWYINFWTSSFQTKERFRFSKRKRQDKKFKKNPKSYKYVTVGNSNWLLINAIAD